MVAVETRRRARRPAISTVLIVAGIVLFPVLWGVMLIGRAMEVGPLMTFFARSDAHVFFDMPGVLGDLRAFPILFTMMPATGATLATTGVAMRRGRTFGWSALVGVGAGIVVFLVAWLLTP